MLLSNAVPIEKPDNVAPQWPLFCKTKQKSGHYGLFWLAYTTVIH
jgi:hypothetical protein